MTKRLTPEREKEIRDRAADKTNLLFGASHVKDLLVEIDALRADYAEDDTNPYVIEIRHEREALRKERDHALEEVKRLKHDVEYWEKKSGMVWATSSPDENSHLRERVAALYGALKDLFYEVGDLHHFGCTEGEWRECEVGNEGDEEVLGSFCNAHQILTNAQNALDDNAQAQERGSG